MTCKQNSFKNSLRKRPLISPKDAGELMGLFKVFANDTRLRLLHALSRSDELCVGDLSQEVGMKPQAVSNQLQRLVGQQVLDSRRNGNEILYRITDTCVFKLLEHGLCLVRESKQQKSTQRRARIT